MRKVILAVLIGIIMLPNMVKAESLNLGYDLNYWVTEDIDNYGELEQFMENNKNIVNNMRNDIIEEYESNYKESYPYYIISMFATIEDTNNVINMQLKMYENKAKLKWEENAINGVCIGSNYCNNKYLMTSYIKQTTTYVEPYYSESLNNPISMAFNSTISYSDYWLAESNFDIIYDENSYYDKININNYRDGGTLTINKGDIVSIPVTNITDQEMREINLNDYEYVILTLRNYEQSEEFQTNMQIKGMVGITPVYNYGQTSKDAVTGVKIQDRCNVNYDSYTNYPVYILKQDLNNNAVYIVKSCKENSSFKYDTNVFNITYVTNENKDDPIVNIGGKDYHVIPYEDLPSTANKNEEENYIPGQSGNMNDTGGLDGAIKGVQQKMSEIWDVFTYFTGLINQIFSALPDELRIILVSAFTIAITLGLIKIFIN